MALDLFADEIYQAAKAITLRKANVALGVGLAMADSNSYLRDCARQYKSSALEESIDPKMSLLLRSEIPELSQLSGSRLEFEVLWSILQTGYAALDATKDPIHKRIESIPVYVNANLMALENLRKGIAGGHRWGDCYEVADVISNSVNAALESEESRSRATKFGKLRDQLRHMEIEMKDLLGIPVKPPAYARQ